MRHPHRTIPELRKRSGGADFRLHDVRRTVSQRVAEEFGEGMSAAASQGCTLLPRSHDYILGITCLVLDESGHPVNEAEVVLELSHVVYHAVEPIRTERKITTEAEG